jgi:biopolymer transport protein ExbD
MKIGTDRKPRSNGIDMVPMINFAFLLLIFVILVGAMSSPEVLPVRPPLSAAQTAVQSGAEGVVIDAAGRIAFGGDIIEPDALVPRAQAWLAVAGASAVLLVKADAEAEADRVVRVLETLRAAGIDRVSLLTSRRDE